MISTAKLTGGVTLQFVVPLMLALISVPVQAQDVLTIDTARWNAAFGSIIWPILGIIFVPWTTLMYVLVLPGGISGFEVLLLMVAIVVDVLSHAGGGYGNRKRLTG